MAEQTNYIPGMCNINQAEIAYRRKAMYLGFAVAVIVFGVSYWLGITPLFRAVITFLPLYVGMIGALQVRNKFCVSYGASGKQNADDGSDSATNVAEKKALAADKKKARIMNIQALALTLTMLAASLLVPAL